MEEHRNSALLVDFDNIFYAFREEIAENRYDGEAIDLTLRLLSTLKQKLESEFQSTLLIGRAYGSWDGFTDAPNSLAMMSIQPTYAIHKPGKSSADLELSLDALEFLLSRDDIDQFCIVGGDRDYLPIVRRIQERGKSVMVVSFERTISGDLKAVVGSSNFIPAESLIEPKAHKEEVPDEPVPGEETAPSPNAESVDAEIEKCIRLIIGVLDDLEKDEIPLVAFFKEYMNEAFVELNHEERKELIDLMKLRGAITIGRREGPFGSGMGTGIHYAALSLNQDHPWVKRVAQNGNEESSGTP
ncbi:MAG: NYN domain-containing protein [Thermoplasmata archaeon]|nr:NYN domain-containing protein [Thermoplasmata archaeon]